MKYLNQNLKLIIIAISVFIVSLATGILIFNHSEQDIHQASIINDEIIEFKLDRIDEGL
ncbi:hypothetical protein KKG71_01675 [Patescibacteria group bacterium]|nr:hypothetical protein [Patescibacteria group bacterium]